MLDTELDPRQRQELAGDIEVDLVGGGGNLMSSGQVNSVDYGQGHATFMDNY